MRLTDEGELIEPNRYGLRTKVSIHVHQLVEEFSNQKTNADLAEAVRQLIDLGLAQWKVEAANELSPTAQLAFDRSKQVEKEKTRAMLVEYASGDGNDAGAFNSHCEKLGFDPVDILRRAQLIKDNHGRGVKRAQRDNLGNLIRGALAISGDEGLPAKQIEKIATRFDYSKSQVARALSDIGAENEWRDDHVSWWTLRNGNH